MAGRLVLVQKIGVRIPVREPQKTHSNVSFLLFFLVKGFERGMVRGNPPYTSGVQAKGRPRGGSPWRRQSRRETPCPGTTKHLAYCEMFCFCINFCVILSEAEESLAYLIDLGSFDFAQDDTSLISIKNCEQPANSIFH